MVYVYCGLKNPEGGIEILDKIKYYILSFNLAHDTNIRVNEFISEIDREKGRILKLGLSKKRQKDFIF